MVLISGENGWDQMEKSTTPKMAEIVGGKSQITIVKQSYLTFPRVKNKYTYARFERLITTPVSLTLTI